MPEIFWFHAEFNPDSLPTLLQTATNIKLENIVTAVKLKSKQQMKTEENNLSLGERAGDSYNATLPVVYFV